MSKVRKASCCPVWLRIVFSVIGILGCCFGVVVNAYYRDYHAMAWALISGPIACLTLICHILYLKNKLSTPNGLKWLKVTFWIGLVSFLAGLCATTGYIVAAVIYKQPFRRSMGENYWIAMLMGLLTLRSGLFLVRWTWAYRRELRADAKRNKAIEEVLDPNETVGVLGASV